MNPLGIGTRLWFWLVCAARVLFDGAFAARVWAVRDQMPQLTAPSDRAEEEEEEEEPRAAPAPSDVTPALVLLALLQREGRLVDFVEQDISGFDDADVGAAARLVHEGCRKALHRHAEVKPVREEDEDSRVAVEDGIDSGAIKLTGKVSGKPPYRGVLKHRGWRLDKLSLPTPVSGHDPMVIAPAEVEL